jgi:hypothetical protein
MDTGTAEAGAVEDGSANCAAGDCAPVDDSALLGDCAALVDISPPAAGPVAGGAADCAGAAFCSVGCAAEELDCPAAPCVAPDCAAGACSAGGDVESDCGAGEVVGCGGGAGWGFACLISDGGGSSGVAGGVAFCGADDCAWHGLRSHPEPQAKPAQNTSAQTKRAVRLHGSPRDAELPATVLIRPLPPAASVRNPRVPSDYKSVTRILQGSLLAPCAPVNRSPGGESRPGSPPSNFLYLTASRSR